jgi:diguanylate cyclase (GGDEF)-like protein
MKAIQLISLQHELGMSIGLDLHLQTMLKEFTKVCIRQLGLASVHYYFLQTDDGDVVLPNTKGTAKTRHLLSIPKKSENDQGYDFSAAIRKILGDGAKQFSAHNKITNEYIYYLALKPVGIIALHKTNRPIEDIIFEVLTPILKKLTISCQASIEHQHLLQAIEARKKAEEAINHLAFHDELTNLPNRRLFMDSLTKELSRSQRHGFLGAVLFLDVNRFKVINDTLGHATGDQLLITIARILESIVRTEDTVARLSGDEFVIQFSRIANNHFECRKAIQSVIDKIHRVFSEPVMAGEHILHVTLSIGVERYPNGNAKAYDILHHADTAMYQAKASSSSVSLFYDKQLSEDLVLRLELEKELQAAVKQTGQFELLYQPQYSADGTCVGAEALIRWNNPERGVISPVNFIPIAEETGLMLAIGQWVTLQACEHLEALVKSGVPATFKKLSINVSAIQFSQENFVPDLLRIIKEKSVPPEMLGIELTESTLIKNIDEVIGIISELREQGITTSIDDFGTGYSSLQYLSCLPIETLKIDKAFVRNIHSDIGNRAIVDAIMALGNSLDLNIIAEGVETKEEFACLSKLECRYYQGYYFNRPMPFNDFLNLACRNAEAS